MCLQRSSGKRQYAKQYSTTVFLFTPTNGGHDCVTSCCRPTPLRLIRDVPVWAIAANGLMMYEKCDKGAPGYGKAMHRFTQWQDYSRRESAIRRASRPGVQRRLWSVCSTRRAYRPEHLPIGHLRP
jgi:hypothetical protein